MSDPKIKLKRSSVEGKIPTPDQVPLGELALNTYDGQLYASKNVGVGTTVIAINPFKVGTGTDSYDAYFTQGNVGIGTEVPNGPVHSSNSSVLNVGVVTANYLYGDGSNISNISGNVISGVVTNIQAGNNITILESPAGNFIITSTSSGSGSGSTRTVTSQTAGAGQTTFNVTYDVGYVDVYLNGVRLSSSDFTATNGTSIVLETASSVNDILEFVAYSSVGLAGTISGPNGQIQYNNSGDIAGAEVYYDGSNLGIGTATPLNPVSVGNTAILNVGVVTANYLYGDGSNLTGLQAGYFEKTDAGINTSTNIGIGTTNPTSALTVSGDANVTGVVTATSFVGNLTGSVTGDATGLSGSPSITVTDITASGNVSIAGTLTYEDVTNVDSVGLITARSGIIATGVVTATSFVKSSNSGGFLKADGTEDTSTYLTSFTETQTLNDVLGLGNTSSTGLSVGVVTATSFVGDGSNLTGLQAGYFEKTDVGIHTLSNIGIGTTNPTDALIVSGDANVTGVVTASSFVGNLSGNATGLSGAPSITVTDITSVGNVSIAGTLTYEDVTSVDAIGIVTARLGVDITTGGLTVNTGGANIIGVTTSTSFVKSGGTSSQFLKADGSVDSSVYITSSDGGNAGTLDGLDSTQFLRSDAIDVVNAAYTEFGGSAVTSSEGGEIRLTSPSGQSNGNTVIDMNGVNLRFFYANSPNKGAYLPLTSLADSVGSRILTTSDEGSGNGLDADTVDGIQASSFLRSDAADTVTGTITFSGTSSAPFRLSASNASTSWDAVTFQATTEWGDTSSYGVLGGDGTEGIMLRKPHVVWNSGHASADIRLGRSGGTSSGGWVNMGIKGSNVGFIGYQDSNVLTWNSSGNLSNNGDNYITFGPNSSWSKYLRVGGNGYQGNSTTANIAATNGNLHIDSATSNATYLNYYAGTSGVAFGNGANGAVAWMGPDGDLWKGSSDNSGSKYWHAGNDGSGSGLDADTVDGYQFLSTQGISAVGNFGQWQGHSTYASGFNASVSYWGWNFVQGNANAPNTTSSQWYRNRVSLGSEYGLNYSTGHYWLEMAYARSSRNSAGHMWVRTCENGSVGSWEQVGSYIAGNVSWHAGNDGSGSGLDADTLDGSHASSFKTNSNTDTNQVYIRNASPTLYLRDTDHNSAMVHCNSDLLYILRGADDSTTWSQVSGQWPFIFYLSNNNAKCGGSFEAVGNVTAYSSDRRLKENFNYIKSPLEKVLNLNGYTFDWKDEVKELGFYPSTEKNDVGLIAQEVQEVIPQAVAPAPFDQEWDKEAEKNISKSGEDYLTVQYEKLVPLLVEAIKEQQSQINILKQRLDNAGL